uniref:Uncharacterized protein n=1 Tax=Peromyscus maniculatus bairdii TaxID=230844 RepID=A0A8C8UID0_PERMB
VRQEPRGVSEGHLPPLAFEDRKVLGSAHLSCAARVRGAPRLRFGGRWVGQVRASQPPAGCRRGRPASPGGHCALFPRTPALRSGRTPGNVKDPRESNSHQLPTKKQWPRLGRGPKGNLPSRPIRGHRLGRLGSLPTLAVPEVRPSGMVRLTSGVTTSLKGRPSIS